MLKGQAKKEYQREYMRKRQGVKNPRVGLITSDRSNNNGSNNIETPEETKQTKLVELRELMANPQILPDVVKTRAPLYRRGFHKTGDLVRMPGSNTEVIVPELDELGNELY